MGRIGALLMWLVISSNAMADPLLPARYDFSVRTVGPTELPTDTSGEWMAFFGPGVASGALGVVAPPLFASGLVVGALLLAPGALIMAGSERRTWEHVATALKNNAFEAALLDALRLRGAALALDDAGPSAHVDVTVNAFGVAGERPERVCFIASADLRVTAAEREVLQDRLIIAETNRSADAPPPQCASLERFATRDAALVNETAAEYVQVLASMVVDRLTALEAP